MPLIGHPSFAKGVVSPTIYGRVDTRMYKSALRTARNALIHTYGGVSNRPGLMCVAPFKYHTAALFPALRRFHQGTSDQYVLEVGDLYMRFNRNDNMVRNDANTITGATAANPVVITAANTYVDGDDIFIEMSAGMTQLDNRRFTVRNPTTSQFELEGLISGNSIDGTGYDAYTTGGTVASIYEIVTPYVQADLARLKFTQTGNTITITHVNYAPRDLTRTDHDAWTLAVNTYAPTIAAPTNGTISSTADTNFQIFTNGGLTVNYRITAISDTDGSFEESLPLTITGTNGSDPPLNTLTWDAVAAADRYAVYRRDNGLYGLLGETELLTYEDKNLATDLTISPPSARNPFSSLYPMASGYYQQRQVYGGTTAEPDKSWYSQTGLRLNMSVSSPLQPSDAITASLASQDVQEIRHYVPVGQDLMVMTNAGEWRVNSGPDSDFSADTIKQLPETNWGASHDVPIVIGKTIVFVEEGSARVRSLGFQFAVDGFDTNDLTILANHLLADEGPNKHIITDWCYGQFPEPRIYMVRSDGLALTMTFDKEQEVVAWTTWDTKGRFKKTISLRRSVNGVEDGIYFGVRRRTAAGDMGNYLERLHSRKFSDVRNAFFLDHSIGVNDPIVITDITNDSDGAVFTTSAAHGLSAGDEIEVTDIEWVDEDAEQFNDLRFTVSETDLTSDTFGLLDFTIAGSGSWDLSSLTYEKQASQAGNPTRPEGLEFNADGTKLFMGAGTASEVVQWSLPTAYDIDGMTDDGITLDTSVAQVGGITSIRFRDSGTKLFVLIGYDLYMFELSVAYDLTTATYDGSNHVDMTATAHDKGFDVDPTGTKIYVMGNFTGKIYEWNMDAWDLTSAVLGNSILQEGSGAASIRFKPDGLYFYTSWSIDETITEWIVGVAWDLSTATSTGVSVAILPNTNPHSILFPPDGSKMLLAGTGHVNVFQYSMDALPSSVDVNKGSSEIYDQGGEVRKLFSEIPGLWCLEGEDATLFLDGNVEENQTPTNGVITVADGRKIARAVVGIPYTCDIELLDIEMGTSPDTIQGELKKITRVTTRFFKSRMPQVGPTVDQLVQMRTRRGEKIGEASGLISGDTQTNLPPDWNSNGRIFYRQSEPVPLTILAVFPHTAIEDEDEG